MGDLSAFVLAGGRSTRMGADKAFVLLNGQSLLGRALELVSGIVSEPIIVGSPAKFSSYGKVLEDQFPSRGPLGGIHSALSASPAKLNLVLAVDMPFVEVGFLKFLVELAREGNALVTVPRAAGHWQPLCSVYGKEFAQVAEAALRHGKNKIDPLFADVNVRVVEEDEIARHGFDVSMFRNLNTLEELAGAANSKPGSESAIGPAPRTMAGN